MRRFSNRFGTALIAFSLLASAGTRLYGQAKDGQAQVRSRAEETLEWWNQIGNKLIAMANDFPEDKYDFKIQNDQRTFAQNLLHVAAIDYLLIGKVAGSKVGPDFGNDFENPSREVYKMKADVVKLLEQAVAEGAAVIQQQADSGLDKTSEFGWETGRHVVRNSYIWTTGIEHSSEHFGQLVVYYRANNLVPPESRPRPARQSLQPPAARVVDLKASDGTVLKASYFQAAKPGPGVLLLHQVNRTRKAWDDVARQLAAAGVNTLTLDMRGFGESGGTPCVISLEASLSCKQMPGDIDTAVQYLVSQPAVKRDVIGVGGSGLLGVDNSVQMARRHPDEVKSLVLLSGETFQPNLQFLRLASQLPGLFVVSDDDEYPPTQEAMELLYITSSNPGKKLVHYSAAQDAPWLWYEPFDIGRVPANGGHGTDMFEPHPELSGIIVDWFVTTLIKTPGHAPADTVASATILNQIELPGGVAQVTQQLMEARRKDPQARLWPEITVDIIGNDHLREGEAKAAIEIFKLNLLAYPESADAHSDLADAYLADGQKNLARRYAEKALTMLDSHKAPASSWSDSEQRRGEIRKDLLRTLKKLDAAR